jgi:hypothetical protein
MDWQQVPKVLDSTRICGKEGRKNKRNGILQAAMCFKHYPEHKRRECRRQKGQVIWGGSPVG